MLELLLASICIFKILWKVLLSNDEASASNQWIFVTCYEWNIKVWVRFLSKISNLFITPLVIEYMKCSIFKLESNIQVSVQIFE